MRKDEKVEKSKKMYKRKEKISMAVMTTRCDVPFVVRKDKVKDFINQKKNPELDKKIKKVVSKFENSIDTTSIKK